MLVGTIEDGDYDNFVSVYRASRGWLVDVVLVSQGGNLDEAMKIGRLIRAGLMATHAPKKFSESGKAWLGAFLEDNPCDRHDCVCASSCFVMWVAGMPRSGNFLGIHRPTFDANYFGKMDPASAERAYTRAVGELDQYLKSMAVTEEYQHLLTKTPSWELAIPWKEIERDLETPSGLSSMHYPAGVDEWLGAKCGSVTAEEVEALEQYDSKTDRKYMLTFGTPHRWNELPDPAYRLLAKKIHETVSCRFAHSWSAVREISNLRVGTLEIYIV